ncbi:hypothetical protein [Actinoplanes lobatus]|uniref:Uncharacterized protein n=1 Tax=Actinoplanes lobatus TaxID=113568 RepID=A0A7W7HLX9_9ACTN|nr:hypothetical protein [Actinoplanes lobatus]MBB4752875.1 hypothetical protein [Actinoplanes lobatus]
MAIGEVTDANAIDSAVAGADAVIAVVDHVGVSDDETYVLAAYAAAHRWLPPADIRGQSLPAEVVSVSECLTYFHPHDQDTWLAPWHLSLEHARHAADDTTGCAVETPVERLWKRRAPTAPPWAGSSVHALAMSVPTAGVDELAALMRRWTSDEPHPILTNLALGASPAGTDLGFEVLGFEDGQFHSWICYGFHRDAARELGVRPNERGLITTLADARRVAELANYGDDAEDGFPEVTWFPALITEPDCT